MVGQRPDRRNIESWKERLSGREIEIFESEAGRMLELLGYPREYSHPRRVSKLEKIGFYMQKRKIRIRKELAKAKNFFVPGRR
jgi:hypothetical protein